jgi:tungstate transport system substrate-binding protein
MPQILSVVSFCIISFFYFTNTFTGQSYPSLRLQSTTTTYDSGFLNYLLPIYEKKTGVKIYPIISGSGRALLNARNGDCDLVLLHSKQDEIEFVKNGYGVKRYDLMYNDFVLVGPLNDPAKIKNSKNIISAFQKIADQKSLFISRGDESGTHKKELSIWHSTPQANLINKQWYFETGTGMGAALNIAIAKNAYVLSDRATWETFKNKSNHTILFQGDNLLFNQYGVILLKHSNPKVTLVASQFIKWMIGKEGQSIIEQYKINEKQLFFPNALSPKKVKIHERQTPFMKNNRLQ